MVVYFLNNNPLPSLFKTIPQEFPMVPKRQGRRIWAVDATVDEFNQKQGEYPYETYKIRQLKQKHTAFIKNLLQKIIRVALTICKARRKTGHCRRNTFSVTKTYSLDYIADHQLPLTLWPPDYQEFNSKFISVPSFVTRWLLRP